MPTPDPSIRTTDDASQGSASLPPRRSRVRVLALIATVPLIAILGGLLVLRTSWFISGRVEGILQQQIGGPAHVGHARYAGDGVFILRDVTVRAPGMAGEAGELISIDRAEIRMNKASLRRLAPVPERVIIDRMRLRISEREGSSGEGARFSFQNLVPRWDSTAETAAPDVDVDSLEIEVGRHAGVVWRLVASRTFQARLTRDPGERGDQGWHNALLQELDPEGDLTVEGRRIGITGEFNARTFAHEFRVPALDLGSGVSELTPSAVRAVLDEMQLSGVVHDVTVGWTERGFALGFDARDLTFRLPVDAGVEWGRYRAGAVDPAGRRPRLRVSEGRFQVAEDRLQLSGLRGTVEPERSSEAVADVPYEIDLTLGGFGAIERGDDSADVWIQRVLETAPFELRFVSREMEVGRDLDGPVSADGPREAVDLPRPVIRVLEEFAFERWRLTTNVDVMRAAPIPGAFGPTPGPVTVAGRATIRDASGRYRPFPYHLDDLEADLTFDDTGVTVERVEGVGSGGARVRLTGDILSTEGAVEVHLVLTADDVPVDERLREAFGPELQEVFAGLRHEPSRVALAAGGRAPAGESLGGTVDLRLAIDRDPEVDAFARTTGTLDLRGVDVLLAAFPYPMRIERGQVRLEPGRLLVQDADAGLSIVTAGGGRGQLTGSVVWAGEPVARPDLTLSVVGDAIGPDLAAALPPSDAEREEEPEVGSGWPGASLSRAGRWLDRLALTGSLDYVARIRGRTREPAAGNEDPAAEPAAPELEIDYDVEVTFSGVSADAAEAIRLVSRGTGQAGDPAVGDTASGSADGPDGVDPWRIRNAEGSLRVTPDSIRLQAQARHGDDRQMRLGGRLDLETARSVDLTIDADGLDVGALIADVVPPSLRARAAAVLERHRPRGEIDASMRVISTGHGDARIRGTIVPKRLDATLGDRPMQAIWRAGAATLDLGGPEGLHVGFDGLTFALAGGDGDNRPDEAPRLRLDGDLAWPDEAPPTASLAADWTGARLESPLTEAILEWVGAEAQRAQLRDVKARGELDLTLAWNGALPIVDATDPASGPPVDAADWSIEVRPRVLSIVVPSSDGEAPVPVALRMLGGSLRFGPGLIQLEDLAGSNGSMQLEASGTVLTSGGIDADLQLGLTGQLLGSQIRALLPAAVREVLSDLALLETRDSRVEGARLRLRRLDGMAGTRPGDPAPGFDIDFNGRLVLDDASLDVGVALGSVSGPFDVHLVTGPSRRTDLTIDARPSSITVAGLPLRDIDAVIHRDPARSVVVLDRLSARTGAGRLVVTGEVSTLVDGPWSVEIDASAVPIGDLRLTSRTDATADAKIPAADLRGAGDGQASTTVVPPMTRQELEGDLYGHLALRGVRGQPMRRTGRGEAVVVNADLFEIPGVLSLVQAAQLTMPAERYDFASASFFLAGPHLHFEELYLESNVADTNAHALRATGSVHLETGRLEGRIRSRSGLLLPLRQVVGTLGDAMAAINLSGTIDDPEIDVELLPNESAGELLRLARPIRLESPRAAPKPIVAGAGNPDDGRGQ